MRKLIFILTMNTVILSTIIIFSLKPGAEQTITYFPLDHAITFKKYYTHIQVEDENNKQIAWTTFSLTDEIIYLRQDVALLFANGKLVGARTKWQQNTDSIKIEEKIPYESHSYWNGITFHYGESHYANEEIRSVQQISTDELFIGDNFHFKKATNKKERETEKLLKQHTNHDLKVKWNKLISYFNINQANYNEIALTDITLDKPLHFLNHSAEQVEQIIGQLWEGLYKNYLIPAFDSKSGDFDTYIPLILIDKQETHLIVLFEINGSQ
ncbi:hypothetical protein [Paracerasibacillus soli]|uniref:Uncharacterized protein n=1 Tax=Paracerasibacillus soli TaxID=480284 RepID=A0ABU5CQF0_9BACI|nr:hypothetical protein [Virgibacillus soli]MDY0408440.1 hypothetical protein [Virgibacillus soli]